MRNIPQALLSFFVLDVALAQIDNSVCRHPTGVYEKGNVDCLGGEVFLRGNYVEVGIHEVGSYGTYNKAPGGSAYAGKNLGFIADFGRDGWGVASTKYPYGKFAGDYFVPGSPVEGWILQWTRSDGVKESRFQEGLISDWYGYARGMNPSTFQITSTPEIQSSLWVAQSGDVEVTKVTQFGNDNLFFTTSVKIQNIGSSAISNFYYMQTVDPDQEQPWSGWYTTDNYVKYQPAAADGSDCCLARDYVHPEFPEVALVIAIGVNDANFFLGLGTINSRGRVSHYGFFETNPAYAYADASGTTEWKSYGGNDMTVNDRSRMRRRDQAIHLTFKYDSIGPGEIIQFDIAHVLTEDDLFTAIASLKAIKISQPTGSVSGDKVLFSAVTNVSVSAINFYVFATTLSSSVTEWVLVDTATAPSSPGTYSVYFDSYQFKDGTCQLKAVGARTDGGYIQTSIGSEIGNAGTVMLFTEDDLDGKYPFYTTMSVSLDMAKKVGSMQDPDSISYFREIYFGGEIVSTLLLTTSTAPYTVTVSVSDLSVGASVSIRAKVKSNSGVYTTTTMFTGIVTRLNIAPTDIYLSATTVSENSPSGVSIGVLSAADLDTDQRHTFTLTDDSAGKFSIIGTTLAVNGPIDFETTPTLTCRIRVSDGQPINCCYEKTFTITVLNVNEAPTSVAPMSFTVAESASVGSTIGTFIAIDPDAGQFVYFSFLGPAAAFAVGSTSGVLTTAGQLDYESLSGSGYKHDLLLHMVDSGSPSKYLDQSVTVHVTDVNEAPSALSLNCPESPCSVEENVPIGTVVGTLLATDQDVGDVQTYSLTGSAGGLFDVDSSSGVITVAKNVDYESLGYKVTITAKTTDSGGLSKTVDFSIIILNIAEAPSSEDTVCFVYESRRIGETVTAVAGGSSLCTVGAASVDGTSLDFEIMDGASRTPGGNADISIQGCSGIFFINNTIDFESYVLYNMSIKVTTEGGVSYARALIYVVDVNEAPVFSDASRSVHENSPSGTLIGDPLHTKVYDQDSLTVPTPNFCCDLLFTIEGGNALNFFSFADAATGQLQVSQAGLNYESVNQYLLTVRVTDKGGLSDTAQITVNIQDVNENPKLTFSTGVFASIAENSASGTMTGINIYASDEDVGQIVTVEITGGNTGGAFSLTTTYDPAFGINAYKFTVQNSAALDYEAIASGELVLTVTATDNGSPVATGTQTYTIMVTDVNEAPSLLSPPTFTIDENSASGAQVGDMLKNYWSDPDFSDSTLFTISNYNGDKAKMFSIDSEDGTLVLAQTYLSFEQTPAFTYTIRVTDKGGLTATATVSISVNDVPEPPIFGKFSLGSVDENIPWYNHSLVTYSGQDLEYRATDDDGDALTFAVVSVDGDKKKANWFFAFQDGNTDSTFIVSNKTFNYEVKNSYLLNLSVTDGLFKNYAAASIQINDVNDKPTVAATQTCYIASDAAVGVEICTIVAQDEDFTSGTNWGVLNYTFASSTAGVKIVTTSNVGTIVLWDDVFVESPTTTVTVVVTDGGGLKTSCQVTIVVITANAPPQCSTSPMVFLLNENTAGGSTVGSLFGSDPVSSITDENNALSAVLIAGNSNNHFRLDEATGILYVASGALINYENLQSYSLAVRVTEVTAEPLSSTCNVEVQVVDVNEPTTFSDQTFSVDENIFTGPLTKSNVAVPNVFVIDEDPADQNGLFSLSCLSCSDNPIAIEASTGALSLKTGFKLNFETFAKYTYTCTWESRGVIKNAVVTVNLANVAETPIVYSSSFDITETSSSKTVGQVAAMDPDFEAIIDFSTTSCRDDCGLKYSIQSGSPNIGQFSIDVNTGIMSVAAVDFENDYNYSFVVKVVDATGLSNTATVKVTINDQADCTADTLVNMTGSTFAKASTVGGEDLIVFGTNFGPTELRMSRQGISPTDITVSAFLQSATTASASSYRYALTCGVDYTGIQDNTMLTCTTPAGVGKDLGVVATITAKYPGGYTSVCTTPFSVGKMSYAPPAIFSISYANALNTDGTSVVEIEGENFGRSGIAFVQATYSNEYLTRTVTCSITTDHVLLSCPTSVGFGSSLVWTVTAGSQRSELFQEGSYGKPSVASVSESLVNTIGGDTFVVYGSNFGNMKDRVTVTYGPNTGFEYTAISCAYTTQHKALNCKTVEGVGSDLKVAVKVGDLTSDVYTLGNFSYRPPTLTSVTGPGSSQASTEGGDVVYLKGTQFGPVSLDPDFIVVKYGKDSNPEQYTASDCKVTTKSTRIECVTVPGTGVGLVWYVSIAGQQSDILEAGTSYGPPVITEYAGEGSVDALTVGNETVYIYGRNFGSTIATLQEVSYSAFNGTKFYATGKCVMAEPHFKLMCQTVPGAGSDLSWSITVDSQKSVSPTTAYAVPTISRIGGGNVLNGSVYGSDVIRIYGSNFGPADAFDVYGVHFLDSVTYGPSGVEYDAKDCVVLSHSELRCRSVQGVGGGLTFKVIIAGQESPTSSSALFSYAAPVLSSLSPLSVSTRGDTIITIKGKNFAIFSLPPLFFDGVEVVVTYLSETRLQFTAPEAATVESVSNDVVLVVGGQLSNTLSVSYNAPVINSVSTIDGANGTLYLIIEGSSFSLNPEVLVYDSESDFFSYATCYFKAHDEVNCITSAKKGNVTVITGPQRSNVGYFEFGPPRVLGKTLTGGTARTIGYTNQNPAVVTVTGQNFGEASSNAFVYFQNKESGNITRCNFISFTKVDKTANAADWAVIAASVEGEDPSLGFEKITCELPTGQGVNNSVKVTRGSSTSLGCGCNGCNAESCFHYLSPRLDALNIGSGGTQGGYQVEFTGDNFGLESTVTVGGVNWPVDEVQSSHTKIVASVPPGEGANLLVVVKVDSQTSTSTSVSRRLAANDIYFSYNAPVITTSLSGVVVGTDGSTSTITVEGSNFGVDGPIVRLGGVLITWESFGHNQIIFYIPPGQGAGLTLSVEVGGQIGYSPDTLSYQPPSITSISPLSCDTSGGRATGVTMTMLGTNFGAVDKTWVLSFGDVTVPLADVISFTSTKIVFYAPEGQGWELPISITVSGQVNTGTTFLFNYNPPEIDSLALPADVNTRGGYSITFSGRSFGISGAVVTIEDPLYDEDSLQYRMPPTSCPLVSQFHTEITCRTPSGAGTNLIVKLQVGSKVENSAAFNFSYSPPRISYFYQSNGGNAAGGERLKVYGENFGAFRTALNITIGNNGVLCPKAVWLADDPVFKYQPYLQCETPRMTVGVKNVSVSVAYQKSEPVDTYKVTCKVGYFGGIGEYCTHCGDPELTGMVCVTDNLYTPYAYDGFYLQYKTVPSGDCSEESQTLRTVCPASLPCLPKEACLGNNTCDAQYEGDRCANCAEGYYKISGECQPCPDTPWLIPAAIAIVILTAAYIGKKLSEKNVSLGILSIGVDYFQVLAVFATANVEWPSSLVYLFNAMSSINLNIDVVAPECYNSVSIPYRTKWILITALPIIAMIVFVVVFGIYSAYLYFVKHRKRGFQEPLYKAFAFYLMIFYYSYLMLCNNTLAVFNCQPSEPSDGYRYMSAVGTNGGRCYKDGTMQQELEPWAILAFIVYSVGFPVFVLFMLYTNRQKAISDQLMKASGKNFSDAEAFSILKFRMIFNRMYYQFKPQYYYWILWILCRKFCLSVSAIIFRENVVFLLALYLLVLFTSYTLEVRYLPYMSTSEYDQVLEDNAHLITENLQEVIIKSSVRTKEKFKAARLGQNDPLITQIAPKLDFFNNYNTVEAYMLISAILVNIAALMFQSEELSGAQSETLTYAVILIVTVSILYFFWVLFSELWVAFFPETPLPLLCIKPPEKKDEEEKLEEVDFVKFDEKISPVQTSEKSGESSVKLQMKLETAEQMIQEQQNEIARLKKGNTSAVKAAFAAPSASARPNKPKIKKQFGAGEFEMQSNPLMKRKPPVDDDGGL